MHRQRKHRPAALRTALPQFSMSPPLSASPLPASALPFAWPWPSAAPLMSISPPLSTSRPPCASPLLSVAPLLAVAALMVLGAAASAADGVALNITNDGAEDIIVTVYDLTIGRDAVVLPHARMTGFTTIPLSVAPDASGMANISWTAVTVDPNEHKCGHAERVGLRDSASVQVHADSTCPPT